MSEEVPLRQVRHAAVADSASVEARLVVGADGAASLVRRVGAGLAHGGSRLYTAVQAVHSASWNEPHFGAVLRRVGSPTSTAGPSRKATRLVVGAAFPAASGADERFAAFVDDGARQAGSRIGRRAFAARALRSCGRMTPARRVASGRDAWLLVGEAPGLSAPRRPRASRYALRSGAALGAALEVGVRRRARSVP